MSNAVAGNTYNCYGKIDTINQPYNGSVQIASVDLYGSSGHRTVCNLATAWKGIEPAVCKGWLSVILMSKAQGLPINVQYVDSNTSCSEQPWYEDASAPWAIKN